MWFTQMAPTTFTFDKQVAGSVDCSCLVSGGAGEAATIFGEGLADRHAGKSVLVGDLEVDGALDLVVLSEPHDDRGRVTADLTLQGHHVTLGHRQVLEALNVKTASGLNVKVLHEEKTIKIRNEFMHANRRHKWLTAIRVGGTTGSWACVGTTAS